MNARKISKLRATQARRTANQRQINRQQRRDRQQSSRATYQGYDADSGLHQCQLEDGSTVFSSALTNAGLAAGDRLSVGRSLGASYGTLNATPR
ncbi:hypothetical protein IFO70_10505 [Phormidium tenue FACHB-886]|nr:hypothetical protein [Phormidium tenue FACHB-886]